MRLLSFWGISHAYWKTLSVSPLFIICEVQFTPLLSKHRKEGALPLRKPGKWLPWGAMDLRRFSPPCARFLKNSHKQNFQRNEILFQSGIGSHRTFRHVRHHFTEDFCNMSIGCKARKLPVTHNHHSPETVSLEAERHLFDFRGSHKADVNSRLFKKAILYTSLQTRPLENTKVLKG